eukprot:gene6039-11414_t
MLINLKEPLQHILWTSWLWLPVGFNRIDIEADTYGEISSKDPEREKRGIADRVIVKSPKSKLLQDFANFLKSGENKTRLIEIVKEEVTANKETLLQKLCYQITTSDVFVVEQLSSNQEEADTKLLLQAVHSLSKNADASVVVRSSLSGDVDINILFRSVFLESPEKEDICNSFGKEKKDVNAVRYEIFKNVYEKKGKIQDLSLLPPCRQLLHLHCQRSNYIAEVWRSYKQTLTFQILGKMDGLRTQK